jgi:hypothetical protein
VARARHVHGLASAFCPACLVGLPALIPRRAAIVASLDSVEADVDASSVSSALSGCRHWCLANRGYSLAISSNALRVTQAAQVLPVDEGILCALQKEDECPVQNRYARAFTSDFSVLPTGLTILDLTAGASSVPLGALRLGRTVITNELKPLASVISHATIDSPSRSGADRTRHIHEWGDHLLAFSALVLAPIHPDGSPLPSTVQAMLHIVLTNQEMSPSRRCPSRRYQPSRCTAGCANASGSHHLSRAAGRPT